ncbi:hypothetical protein [Actinomadura madurae]|uniref:hypothetical protein n=1 Tax=Actinomadura madurae TaxID=1993 RepID=UPI002026D6E1|nr:hypothetical protein [Actinomadura madurae]MCP9948894.1 hypothetical protein [Actinomadura madurae]MCP9965669.1 hypothetical protein [Actinomadura madurae]MCP9978139.1 hypothetical protein [Actinomadura madurae]MCQ0010341.1 hypothetical protein [Actinomadura madurae]URN05214.1 hypothetical protein LUW74_19090 [Actinomadura madurae]
MGSAARDPGRRRCQGEVDRAQFDLLHGLSLLEEFTHAGEGDLADALRPFYIEYLSEHAKGT